MTIATYATVDDKKEKPDNAVGLYTIHVGNFRVCQ